ncbi:MAG: polynucleotide adenylyltransferase PcnB [Pseudomonadota bacterium]
MWGSRLSNPIVIPRAEHAISRSNISKNALRVLYRLHDAGFQAYLVGGGVRDLLLGREPKDFDIVTDALPAQVKEQFRNARLIGRRFVLAHVQFGSEVVEVATFRGQSAGADNADRVTQDGMILRDNIYGTMEEDVWRRDFTVNALYYNIADFSVVDYVDGLADLKAGVLRLIGDPDQRYREDPVRMLRAVRFAAKLGFRIEADCERSLIELGHLLEAVPPARLFEEVLKLFLAGDALKSFELLRHYGLFGQLFPATEAALANESQGFPNVLVANALRNTDARIVEMKPVTPAFLFAALIWPAVLRRKESLIGHGVSAVPALQQAAAECIREVVDRVSVPKRFAIPMQEIWSLQDRFMQRNGKRPARLSAHPRFRAAYDFMLLRSEAGEVDAETARWWTEYQASDEHARIKSGEIAVEDAEDAEPTPGQRPRRRRRGRGRPRPPGANVA